MGATINQSYCKLPDDKTSIQISVLKNLSMHNIPFGPTDFRISDKNKKCMQLKVTRQFLKNLQMFAGSKI